MTHKITLIDRKERDDDMECDVIERVSASAYSYGGICIEHAYSDFAFDGLGEFGERSAPAIILSPDEARALRDWLNAHVPDARPELSDHPVGGGKADLYW